LSKSVTWPSITLGFGPLQIIDGDRGKNYPSQQDFASTGYCLFLNAGNVTKDGFSFSDVSFINADKDNALGKGKLRRNDVILTTRGTVGNSAYFDKTIPFNDVRINSGMVILRADPSILDPYFLYLFVRSANFNKQVTSLITGSAQPQLPIRDMNRIGLSLPSLPEQRAIASILGALDDKIELNRKMSATLEAMARAIFKSWFVDFDPVRAKVQGQSIGLASEIADFFPNVLERSEARYVPSGWNVQTLSSLCHSIERGLSPIYQPGSNRFIINQKVNRGSTLDLSQLKELAINFNVGAAKMTQEWDVLVNCLGEGTLGRIYLFRSTESYAVDQHMAVCRPRNQGIGAFIYQILNSVDGQNTIESIKTGSTGMTMLNISRLRDFPCLWPGKALIDAYGESVRPIWKRINAAERESQLLTALRDLLLPKLISGELRVSEAERILEMSV